MEICIDESGSFVTNPSQEGAWCIVSAYVSPETEKRKYKKILNDLKKSEGVGINEIKLHQVNESNFMIFLSELGTLKGALFAVATDSAFNSLQYIKSHKSKYMYSINSGINEMKYAEGKLALEHLSNQLESIPPQLYVQLWCQVTLIHSIIDRGINYFSQRTPMNLNSFKWRIDQKEPSGKTRYEDVFEKFAPPLLQAISLDKPGVLCEEFDYSFMSDFFYAKGKIPEYLIKKVPHLKGELALNIKKIFRQDLKFIDSKKHEGIQIADLLASGLRRLMKGGFKNNEKIALLFSQLLVQDANRMPPIKLITFDSENYVENAKFLPKDTEKLVYIMIKNCRPFFEKRF